MPTMDYDCAPSRSGDGAEALAALLAMQDDAGVQIAVVKTSTDEVPDNRWLYELIKDNPRCVGMAIINPRMGKDAVTDLERCIKEFGFRGMKLMPTVYGIGIESTAYDPLMRKAAEFGIPVTIHSGGIHCMPTEVALLAARHPDVNVIMDHMGYRYYTGQAILAAKQFPNIYLGTATANNEPGAVMSAIRQIGADRVVYGSNCPANYPDLAVAALKRLKLDADSERKLLGDNLARLYGIAA